MPRVVQDSSELRRVLALPRRPQEHSEELARDLTPLFARPGGRQYLRVIQATALYEMWRAGGLFGPIGVGEGKTLITLLAALVFKAKAPVLLQPAKLLEKTRREMIELSRHWRIPNHVRMYSYETLSRADHVHLLHRHPVCDLLICDECHKIRNPAAAVSKRVKRFFEQNPAVPFVAVSGSICEASLRDYEHLLRWALKSAPLPRGGELDDWADALDEHDRERPHPGALVLLSGGNPTLPAVRAGYRRRLVETPGVVASVSSRIGVSLLLRGVRYPQGPAIVEAFRPLRADMALPDGTELVSAMETWRHARELALGFWGRWDPPAPKEWLVPRAAWGKRLREILGRSRTWDSEQHLIRAIDAGEAHRDAKPILDTWRAVKDTFTPNPVPVWIDDAPVEYVAAWGSRHKGIIWCDHVPFAKELAKRTKWAYYGQQGLTEDGRHVMQHRPSDGTCIVSRQSGAEGFNLQRFSEALVTGVVANAKQSEQLFGRLHRPGQTSDVTFDLMLGCREHVESFWRSKARAGYVLETTGNEHKILYADTDVPAAVNESGPQWA